MHRPDHRAASELRPVRMTPGFFPYAEGSVLIEMGQTRVACAASLEERVPPFLAGRGRGWVTAEYSMLPRATQTRTQRDITRGKQDGRSVEIQRLIGRSLRAAVDLKALGERTMTIDCDVLQADGGTRTAAISGAYVAMQLACDHLLRKKLLSRSPLRQAVAAISVGVVQGTPLLDLCYAEDAQADVDFNVVMTDHGEFVEVQGSAEGATFSPATLSTLLALAQQGINSLFAAQRAALAPQATP